MLTNAGKHERHAWILSKSITTSASLQDLSLGFGCAQKAPTFFIQLSNKQTSLSLRRRLVLFQLPTRKKYLKKFLRQTDDTLKALKLDCVSLDAEGDSLAQFLADEMTFEEITLRCINVGDEGMRFDNISLQRPRCPDQVAGAFGGPRYERNGWILLRQETYPEHELVLKDDGRRRHSQMAH